MYVTATTSRLAKRLTLFCKNTQLHGLKYTENDGHRSVHIRWLWAIVFVIYCVLMAITFISLFNTYKESSISFLSETTYLDWNTQFPAVTVCQIAGLNLTQLENLLESKEDASKMEFFVSDLLFFSGSCFSCQTSCTGCPKLNFSQTVLKLRKPCGEILSNCQWNQLAFDCCQEFQPLETEYGVCYSINAFHSANSKSKLNMTVNRHSGPGRLSADTNEDVRIYLHAPEDVPFINAESSYRTDVLLGDTYEIYFNVVEIENDPNIVQLSIEQRECRYPWEVPADLKVHRFYSYSACLVQCHAENHFKLCNCTHHLMPYYNQLNYCDINGLRCLTDNFETLNRLHARGSDKPGLTCDCLPSCTEPEYNLVSKRRLFNSGAKSGIRINMQSLPTSKFKRVVVKTVLDFIVSIGGAAGLFIGASLLTIVEVVYWFVIRSEN